MDIKTPSVDPVFFKSVRWGVHIHVKTPSVGRLFYNVR